MTINVEQITPAATQRYLQYVIAPRPICFASTVDAAGQPNLSPFSYFNLFSIDPPIVIFSPLRRMRNNTTKHTLQNLKMVPEVVINVVDYDMVQQASLASCEYPGNVNEFIKAGLDAVPASLIRPPMVKKSPVKLECRVDRILSLGEKGGAGQLVVCRVLVIHVEEKILSPDGFPDQEKLDLVARLGGDWYCRVLPSLFKVAKPNTQLGIGIDSLPGPLRESPVLTGHELAQLANVESIPASDPDLREKAMSFWQKNGPGIPETDTCHYHNAAKFLINEGRVDWAWQVLLTC